MKALFIKKVMSFIIFIYIQVQDRCREEILRVVGSSRQPDLGNFTSFFSQDLCYKKVSDGKAIPCSRSNPPTIVPLLTGTVSREFLMCFLVLKTISVLF
jgi:hypothetical protein